MTTSASTTMATPTPAPTTTVDVLPTWANAIGVGRSLDRNDPVALRLAFTYLDVETQGLSRNNLDRLSDFFSRHQA